MTSEKTKVYELAKELGMESFSLLDQLKDLGIQVKSHMSAIEPEEVSRIRDFFSKEKKSTTEAKATSTKKSTVRKKSATAAASTASDEEGKPAKKALATTVIRRRAKTTAEQTQRTEEEIHDEMNAEPTPTVAATPMDSTAEPMLSPVTAEAPITSGPAISESEPEDVAVTTQPPQTTMSTPLETPQKKPSEPPKGSGLKIPSLLGAKREGVTVKSSSILTIVKEEPRKPLPTPKKPPVLVTPRSSPLPQVGIVRLEKDAIDKLVEEEQAFKKKAAKTREGSDEDVKVADYRAKKELVFLPKKKKLPLHKEIKKTAITTPAAHKRVVKMEDTITVSQLAQALSIKATDLMRKLMNMGMMVNLHHALDVDTTSLIAGEYGFEVENIAFKEEDILNAPQDAAEDLKPRPPIVTVMGHVDHGKTSLLDAIRSAKVAAGEAGGITQHIGAYTVELNGRQITFIDTPGHEAFTVMRARGANVTDIVILVVAADDGVMPQTREAVDHAKAAQVPIIVAVNKIDRPSANPEKVMKGLAEINVLSEEWGGDTIFVRVSALQKLGIDTLLESILLQAEMLDLKANPNRPAEGNVLEARLDRSRGSIINVIVKSGTLKVGDYISAGTAIGKVKALMNEQGKQLQSVSPGHAAEVLGLENTAMAGDSFHVTATEAEARKLSEFRLQKQKAAELARQPKITLENLFSKVQQGNVKELPIILKTDVFGSTEALKESINKLSTEKVKVKILSASTGGITESDVMLASASNAIIIGFNVRPETKARAVAEAEGVEIKSYSIIYELLDDMKKAMAGILDKKAVEKYQGRAEVREIFQIPKAGVIAGCSVIDGKMTRNGQIRLLRDSRVIYTGKLSSLKRFKDDVKEVLQGYECGMGIENFNDIKPGDLIEAFTVEMVLDDLGTTLNADSSSSNTAHL